MQRLKKENKDFIKWADDKLNDKLFVQLLATKAIYKFVRYVNSVPIRQKVHDKLVSGGKEHGEPTKYNKRQINKELEMEFLDLFGWQLIELYIKGRRNIKPSKLSK
jgi:hypothetical protein